MKKIITVGSLIGSFMIFLLTVDIADLLLRFIAVGELPGGSTVIAPDTMLFVTAATLGFVCARLSFAAVSYFKKSPLYARTLPKRRYSTTQ